MENASTKLRSSQGRVKVQAQCSGKVASDGKIKTVSGITLTSRKLS
jgi:hypothetical protein